jgi:uncharacterized protein YraI
MGLAISNARMNFCYKDNPFCKTGENGGEGYNSAHYPKAHAEN